MNPRLLHKYTEAGRQDLALAVSEDLRCLVQILGRLCAAEIENDQVFSRIFSARLAAQRGLLLTERLSGGRGRRRLN